MRIGGDNALAILDGFVNASQSSERAGAIEENVGIPGAGRERRVVAGERLLRPVQLFEQNSAIAERIGVLGRGRKRLFESEQRLLTGAKTGEC